MPSIELGVAVAAGALLITCGQLQGAHTPDIGALAAGSTDDDALVHHLRTGEISSGTLILGAGAAVALLAGAWWPLLLAAGAVALSVFASEYALRRQNGATAVAPLQLASVSPIGGRLL